MNSEFEIIKLDPKIGDRIRVLRDTDGFAPCEGLTGTIIHEYNEPNKGHKYDFLIQFDRKVEGWGEVRCFAKQDLEVI